MLSLKIKKYSLVLFLLIPIFAQLYSAISFKNETGIPDNTIVLVCSLISGNKSLTTPFQNIQREEREIPFKQTLNLEEEFKGIPYTTLIIKAKIPYRLKKEYCTPEYIPFRFDPLNPVPQVCRTEEVALSKPIILKPGAVGKYTLRLEEVKDPYQIPFGIKEAILYESGGNK